MKSQALLLIAALLLSGFAIADDEAPSPDPDASAAEESKETEAKPDESQPKGDPAGDPDDGDKPEPTDNGDPKEDPKEPSETDDPKGDDPKDKEPADSKTEDPKTTDPKDPKAEDSKTDSTEEPDGDKSPARLAYDKQLDEWRGLLRDLRDLRDKYATTEKSKAAPIEAEWEAKMQAGHEMIPKLKAAAVAAYEEAPNEDRQLTRFVAKLAGDAWHHDNHAETLRLTKILIDNEAEYAKAYGWAFDAAFGADQFELAEEFGEKAAEEAGETEQSAEYKATLADVKKKWEREAKIREEEAKKDDLPRVKLTTTKGDLVIELYEDHAPDTVGNFVSLVEAGKYDDTVFHRVLEHFMAQGGDPRGDGTGGPGYNIFCECHTEEARHHFHGTLSMAHAGRDTGGSQFFLTFRPTPHLDGKHTVFGRVIEGLDVLPKLQRVDPSGKGPKPELDKIIKAEVIRKRDHEYKPNKVQQ